MPTSFQFRAVTPEGKIRTGSLTAETQKAAATELRKQGLTPVFIGLGAERGSSFRLPTFTSSRRSVLFFTQELATLLLSGIPLDRALSVTTELTTQPAFKLVIQDLLRVIKGGRSLADSLAQHPEHFSSLYVNMVRAGEASGSLAQVFERLAEFERTRDDLRNYITGALVYPALLSLVGLGSVTILLYWVVPRFATIFESGQMRMPTSTRILLEASNILREWGWLALILLVVAAVGFAAFVRTPNGRLWWDGFRLKIPLLGEALRKAETARFARAMGTLVANSVPLVQSLGIARAILGNQQMANSLEHVSQGVKRGEGIAAPLRRTGQFPMLASHLLSVGEETGRLDVMFARMADIYESDTRDAVRRFTALFEPVIILVMGLLIGSLVLSILMAITSINEVSL